jgi:hypothetical protein
MAKLVRLNVGVIVAVRVAPNRTAKNATRIIPSVQLLQRCHYRNRGVEAAQPPYLIFDAHEVSEEVPDRLAWLAEGDQPVMTRHRTPQPLPNALFRQSIHAVGNRHSVSLRRSPSPAWWCGGRS